MKQVFLSSSTLRAIQREVESMPLPATLSNVCMVMYNSKKVLEAFSDDGIVHMSQEERAVKLELLTGDLSLSSPSQKRKEREDVFVGMCKWLCSKGSSVTLHTWQEVEEGLKEAFLLSALDDTGHKPRKYKMPDSVTTVATYQSPGRKCQSGQKSKAPKRAERLSPRRKIFSGVARGTRNVVRRAVQDTKNLSYACYHSLLEQKLGPLRYNRIYTQAVDDIDARIASKEAERSDESSRIEEVLARAERERLEKEARESAANLMRDLDDEERKIVRNATMGIGPLDDILVQEGADSVQRGSLHTLQPRQWLNDEVINYFLKNCLAKRDEKLCHNNPSRKRSHFFNSFFVQTLFDDKNNDERLRGKYNYKNVKRWGRKVPGKDIFNLKYIICPVNEGNVHWVSAVIFMEEKKIQWFDSMGGTDMYRLNGLLRYLKDEWNAKKKGQGEFNEDEWELVRCTADTPRQANGYDCGVFTCMICDFISKDQPLLFNQNHINQCRDRIALSIMKNCAIE